MKDKNIEKNYDPHSFEDRIYNTWESKGYFKADAKSKKEPYTIVIPPPNVTGKLHMGHALDETLQDILIRYKRLQGYEALWLPGTDHAGIATQIKVEEVLRKEKGRGFLPRSFPHQKRSLTHLIIRFNQHTEKRFPCFADLLYNIFFIFSIPF